MSNVLVAFLMTLIAGLATGIGGLVAFYKKEINSNFLSVSLGFSAGVMLYVSMIEIFPEAREILGEVVGNRRGDWWVTIAFFVGIGVIALIDKWVPEKENPHEIKEVSIVSKKTEQDNELLRVGIFTALAIAIHNFPEGFATFVAALKDPTLGMSIAVAIAIHNIPEGIAVSVPVYYATKDKKRALKYSFLSGLSEPLGAIVGYILLRPILNDVVFGMIFASVAGIMVYISLDGLLPTAQKYGEHHLVMYGIISGMGVMALSLLLF